MANTKTKTKSTNAHSNGQVVTAKGTTSAGRGKKAQAKGTYGIKSWDEKTWDGKDHKDAHGAKLTHAKVEHDFHGDFEGEGSVQYVMSYLDDANATFVGLLNMTGKLGDRSGSFIAVVEGKFENGAAASTWTVIDGSGTGDFTDIKGKGSTVAKHGDSQPFTFDYSFPK